MAGHEEPPSREHFDRCEWSHFCMFDILAVEDGLCTACAPIPWEPKHTIPKQGKKYIHRTKNMLKVTQPVQKFSMFELLRPKMLRQF